MLLKTGQDIGRLPGGEEKLDCISVSFAPVRMEVEILNRKYWDALETTLHRSVVRDAEAVEEFATQAMDTLRKQPQSVSEIAEANQRHRQFEEKTPELLKRFHEADSKNKVLAAWTKSQAERLARVAAAWDNYVSLMDNHEMIISKQVEAIKANLDTQVGNLGGEIEKFKLRWDGMKPKEDSMDGSTQGDVLQKIAIIK